MRIPRFKVMGVWLIAAVLMPALVLLISILTGGDFGIEASVISIFVYLIFFWQFIY